MNKKLTTILTSMLLVVALVLSGCGGGNNSGPAGGEIDKNKEVIIGIPSLPDTFELFQSMTGYESYSLLQVYDTLLGHDENNNLIPRLAEDWIISDDAKVFTFKLHEGILFSDGTEFTAEDVKFSLEQSITGPFIGWIYEGKISEINVLDKYTVEIKLNDSNVSFVEYLGTLYSMMGSKAAYEEYGDGYGTSMDKIVGCGPYKVVDWNPGVSISFEARDDYFGGTPDIKRFKMVVITDFNTAAVALRTGEIDYYDDNIPGINYKEISGDPNVNTATFVGQIVYQVNMNNVEGMFSDVQMRQAVAHAIDKQAFIDVGSDGFGTAANYMGDRKGANAGDPEMGDCWPYEYNPEKAAELVEQAGHKGADVVIKTYSNDPYPALATVLQDALTKIGLNASISQMERTAFLEEVVGSGNYEIMVCRIAFATNDMDETVNGVFHTEAIGYPGNWTWYSNPVMDELLDSARKETDPEARKDFMKQALQISLDEAITIPLYYPTGSRAYSRDLTIAPELSQYGRYDDIKWAE